MELENFLNEVRNENHECIKKFFEEQTVDVLDRVVYSAINLDDVNIFKTLSSYIKEDMKWSDNINVALATIHGRKLNITKFIFNKLSEDEKFEVFHMFMTTKDLTIFKFFFDSLDLRTHFPDQHYGRGMVLRKDLDGLKYIDDKITLDYDDLLKLAVHGDLLGFVKYIVVDKKFVYDDGILFQAIIERKTTIIKCLFDANPQHDAEKGWCLPMLIAAEHKNLDAIKIFVQGGFDIHVDGNIVLVAAAQNNYQELINYILTGTSDERQKYLDDAVRTAINKNNPELQFAIVVLIQLGADENLLPEHMKGLYKVLTGKIQTVNMLTTGICLITHNEILPGASYYKCKNHPEHIFSKEMMNDWINTSKKFNCLLCSNPLEPIVYVNTV